MLARSLLPAAVLACFVACGSVACGSAVRSDVRAPVARSATAVVLSSYRAPRGCPDEQAYVRSVESRSQTLRLRTAAGTAAAADRLHVRIQADTGSAGWRGQLQIEGSHPLQREVRGERCEDVALALALIAVLRLDAKAGSPELAAPQAGSLPERSPAVPGERAAERRAEGSAPAALPPDASDTVLLPDSAVKIVRSRGPRRVARGDELLGEAQPRADTELRGAAGPRAAPGGSWRPSLAAHVGFVSAPSHALQARLRAELQLGQRLQSGSVALGFGYASAGDQNASADLDFALLSGQLDICPLALGAASWMRGCAALSGGVFSVSAQALDDDLVSQSSTRAWAALGPSLEAGIPLGSRWTLRVLAEVSFLLVRDSFEVERIVGDEAGQPSQITRTLLYRPPLGSLAASLGLGYAF